MDFNELQNFLNNLTFDNCPKCGGCLAAHLGMWGGKCKYLRISCSGCEFEIVGKTK